MIVALRIFPCPNGVGCAGGGVFAARRLNGCKM